MDPCALHFVEIKSAYCLYLQDGFEFFNKIWKFDQIEIFAKRF